MQQRKQRDNLEEIREKLHYLWYEGLPNSVRICLWPMLIGNHISLSLSAYAHFKRSFFTSRQSSFGDPFEAPKLSLYLQNDYNDKFSLQQNGNDSRLSAQKIDHKLSMWIRKHIDDIEDHEIPPDVFKSVLTSVLGAYSEFRPDVGFITGLEKIAAHFLLIFLPY